VTRVTVVIPAWGEYADLVPAAAASVRRQAIDAHVLVVDNASARPVRAPSGCELVRSDVRLSRGEARNLGLAHVHSEYVVFLDADDLLVPGALPRLVAALDARPDAPAVVGRIVDRSGRVFRAPRRVAAALAARRRLLAWLSAAWPMVPTQGCTVMSTQAVRDAHGYGDASYGEDWMLAVCLAFRGPIVFDPAPALVYTVRPGEPRPSRRARIDSAARVRGRMAEVALARAPALTALALAQRLAIVAAGPLARLRRARAAPDAERILTEELTPSYAP
jgi:hypothetical protein